MNQGDELWTGLQRMIWNEDNRKSFKKDLKGRFPIWLKRRNEAFQNPKNRNKPVFPCGCSHCLSYPDPSSGIAENYNRESFYWHTPYSYIHFN